MKEGKKTFMLLVILAICLPDMSFAGGQEFQNTYKTSKQSNTGSDSTNRVLLMISTDPPGATLFLDDSLIGHTPTLVETSAGTHKVNIWHYGYERLSENITVDIETQVIEFALKRATPKPPYNTDRQTNIFQFSPVENSAVPFPPETQVEYQYIQGPKNKYARKSAGYILLGATSAVIAIGSYGVADHKYDLYKNSYENRDKLKRQIQFLDVLAISSAAVCLLSTYLSIYYSKLSRKFIPSENMELSLMPMGNGGGLVISYKIPQKR